MIITVAFVHKRWSIVVKVSDRRYNIYIEAGPANEGFLSVTLDKKSIDVGVVHPLIARNSTHELTPKLT